MAEAESDKVDLAEKAGASPAYDGPRRRSSVKDPRIGEAAELYGDVQTAEEYGYVSRG